MIVVSRETFVEWLCVGKGIDRKEFKESAEEFSTARSVLSKFKRNFKGGKLGLVEGLAALSHHYPIEHKYIRHVIGFAKLRNDIVHRGMPTDESELLKFIEFLKDFFKMFMGELEVDEKVE